MSNNLQMSLKTEWFEMTKSGIKTEDYRELTPYWISRLVNKPFSQMSLTAERLLSDLEACPNGVFKKFTHNVMTLGYPKKSDTDRTKIFEHAGIEIRNGNPEWGAEPGKLYFVIKHGKRL